MQRGVSLVVVLLILFLITVTIADAVPQGEVIEDPQSQDFWQSDSADISSASSSDVQNAIQNGWISDTNMKKITVNQLTEESFKKINDKSKLSEKTLSDYISTHAKESAKIKTSSGTEGGTLPNGGFYFNQIESLIFGDFSLTNGRDIRYENKVFTIDSADTITIDDGVLTQVLNYQGDNVKFRVESADKVQIRCLTLDEVKNTDFSVYTDSTEAEPDKDTPLYITDCSQTESTYLSEATNSGVSITDNQPVTYSVLEGKLVFETATHRDVLASFEESTVTYDFYDGFQCLTLSPRATYFYIDKLDSKRDLSVRNPSYGIKYDLCLKRTINQNYPLADGVIDFIGYNLEFSGMIDLLKYPVSYGTISSLQLKLIYSGLSDQVFKAVLDKKFMKLKKSDTEIPLPQLKTVTKAYPNNFYEIINEPIDEEIHQLIHLNEVDEATDTLIEEYDNVNISEDGVLKTGRMTVLPPNHPKIKELLNS